MVGFTETVHRICAPYDRLESGEGGRPPVDPAVLMRMLIVGLPEGIGSERGIASRCADSLESCKRMEINPHTYLEGVLPGSRPRTLQGRRAGKDPDAHPLAGGQHARRQRSVMGC